MQQEEFAWLQLSDVVSVLLAIPRQVAPPMLDPALK